MKCVITLLGNQCVINVTPTGLKGHHGDPLGDGQPQMLLADQKTYMLPHIGDQHECFSKFQQTSRYSRFET